jgi:putative heme iron utilization protein
MTRLQIYFIARYIEARDLGITGALKFENCHFTVTAAKENMQMSSCSIFFL